MSEPRSEPRERLLEGAIDHIAANGVGDVTLRRLAGALGTSHRMLLYHFGSRDELLIAVIERLEERQRERLAHIDLGPELSVGETLRRMWRLTSDPALEPYERLFFELYGQALQGRPHALPFLTRVIEPWLAPLTEMGERHGLTPEEARASARLSLAVARGMLLDLLATGDRSAVDGAVERWIQLYELGLPSR